MSETPKTDAAYAAHMDYMRRLQTPGDNALNVPMPPDGWAVARTLERELLESSRALCRSNVLVQELSEKLTAAEQALTEEREYAREGHHRAEEFQTINGHKNTEIDSLKEQLRRASNTIKNQEQLLAAEARDKRDAERLDFFERNADSGGCASLLYDDNGHWAVVEDGTQTVPAGEGPSDIETCFWIEAAKWHDSPRAAIDAALAALSPDRKEK